MRRALLTAKATAAPTPDIAFVQALQADQSKVSGTSLALTTGGTKTITVGNHIFVAYAEDPGTTTSPTVTDNLGNTYTLVTSQVLGSGTNGVRTRLWRAPITTGGSLTTITCSWTTAVAAKAACAGEYSGVGTISSTDGYTSNAVNGSAVLSSTSSTSSPAGGAVIFAGGIEEVTTFSSPVDTYPATARASIGTTGSTSTTNITVVLADRLTASAESYTVTWPYVSATLTVKYATATGIYNKA